MKWVEKERGCMAPTVYPCPICGRERNRQGEFFTDPTTTRAHVGGAHDDEHEDVDASSIEPEPVERDEDDEPVRVGQANNLIETVRGEETVAQAAQKNAQQTGANSDELTEHDLTLEELRQENAELRTRVDRLEAVVAELSEAVEITAILAGDNSADSMYAASAVYENETDARLQFDTDVLGVREDAMERGQYP